MHRNNTDQRWIGSQYHQNSQPQYKAAMSILSELLPEGFSGDEKILDIGCGSGTISEQIALKVPHGSVFAIDLSDDMIKYAKEKYASLSNLKFRVLDAQHILFENEFDLVVSFFCFHWIPDQQKVLTAVELSLKKNGRALIAFISAESKHHLLLQAIIDVLYMPHWQHFTAELSKHHYYPQSAEDFESMIKIAGLHVLAIKEYKKIYSFATQKELVSWLSAWMSGLAVVAKVPQDSYDRFVEEVAISYNKYVPAAADGSIEFMLPILVAYAQK